MIMIFTIGLILIALFIGFPIYVLVRLSSLSSRIDKLEKNLKPKRKDSTDEETDRKIDKVIESNEAIENKKPEKSSNADYSLSLFKVFGGIGLLMILLGLVYFYMYAVDRGWIGILGRIAIGIIASLVFISIGMKLRKYDKFSQLIIGMGLGIMYFTIFATYFFREYRNALGMTLPLNLGLSFLLMFGGLMIGMKINRRFIVYLSYAIGYLASFIVCLYRDSFYKNDLGYYLPAFYYTLLIGILMLILNKKSEKKDKLIAVISQIATYLIYLFSFMALGNLKFPPVTLIYLFLIYGIYYLHSKIINYGLINLINYIAAVSFGLTYFYNSPYIDYRGVYLILLAGLALIEGKTSHEKKISLISSIIIVGLAVPVQFDYGIVSMIWVLISLGLAYLGRRTNERYLEIIGWISILFPYIRTIAFDIYQHPLINRALPVISVLTGTYALLKISKDDIVKDWLKKLYVIYNIALFSIWIGIEADNYIRSNYLMHAVISISWALIAIITIGYGLAKKRKYLNWTGVALFIIVIGKVLIVDISYLSNIMRVLVLIGVGVLALIGSFIYVKKKDIIKEEFL